MIRDNRGLSHYHNQNKCVNISAVCAELRRLSLSFINFIHICFGAAIFDALSVPLYQPIRSGLPYRFRRTSSTKWPNQSGVSFNKTWHFLVLGVGAPYPLKGGVTRKTGILAWIRRGFWISPSLGLLLGSAVSPLSAALSPCEDCVTPLNYRQGG